MYYWTEYDGHREKTMYEVRLKNGEQYKNCYPNACSWLIYGSAKPCGSKDIEDHEVSHIRPMGYGIGEYMARQIEKDRLAGK